MKVGIITFQLAWNCGAVLQCYALQSCLEQLGCEVEVINYRPEYKEYRYKKFCNPFVMALKEWTAEKSFKLKVLKASKKFIRTILNYRINSEHMNQWNGFQKFTGESLHLTKIYTNLKELEANAPDCDVYISGSDQLWNPKLTNNRLDAAYFMKFGSLKTRKITYAISACELNLQKYGEQLKEYASGIDAISFREKNDLISYETLLETSISICPDPTFLVDTKTFDAFAKSVKSNRKDYILVYALEDGRGNEDLFKYVNDLRKHYRKKVLVICGPHKWPYPVDKVQGVIPYEFIFYIKNAFCIVSNSFHATVFSILYNKRFITLGFENRNIRMQELLLNLGLNDRMITQDSNVISIMEKDIDYRDVEKRIEMQRRIGIDYLKKNVGIKAEEG